MVAGLEKLDAVSEDLVDKAVRLVDPARPDVAAEVFERFRLANAGEGISQNRLDQIEDAERSLAIGVDPVAEILEAFVLQDCGPGALGPPAQDASDNPSSRRSERRSVGLVRPRRPRVNAASNRTAFSGERRR